MDPIIIFQNVTKYQDNINKGNMQNNTDTKDMATQIATSIYIYYTPILVILGVLGNIISVYVFFVTKMRNLSTSIYLSALAISDTLFLLQLVPPWLSVMKITEIFNRKGFCEVFVYITYVTCSLSAWLVLAFTLERFVAVIYPLKRNSMCTVTRARYIIGGIVIMSILLNLPVMKYTKVYDDKCHVNKNYISYARRFNIMDTIVSFSMPLAGIVFFNAWIMKAVLRLGRIRLMKSEGLKDAINTCLTGNQRAQQKVTLMLLIVSSVYVLLNLPTYVIRLVAYAYDLNSIEAANRWMALQLFSGMFFHTNFGINFFLYCLTGQNFRRALLQSMPCLIRRRFLADTTRDEFALQPRTGSITMSSSSRTEMEKVSARTLAGSSVAQKSYDSGHDICSLSNSSSPEIEETSFSGQPPHACDIEAATSATIHVEINAVPNGVSSSCRTEMEKLNSARTLAGSSVAQKSYDSDNEICSLSNSSSSEIEETNFSVQPLHACDNQPIHVQKKVAPTAGRRVSFSSQTEVVQLNVSTRALDGGSVAEIEETTFSVQPLRACDSPPSTPLTIDVQKNVAGRRRVFASRRAEVVNTNGAVQRPYNRRQFIRNLSNPFRYIFGMATGRPTIAETRLSVQPLRTGHDQPVLGSTAMGITTTEGPTRKHNKCKYRNRPGHFIRRWKFDNSRQNRNSNDTDQDIIDMKELSKTRHPLRFRRISQTQLCTVTQY